MIRVLAVVDPLLAVLVYPAGVFMKLVRTAGLHRLPLCRRALLQVGVLPVRNHYFEPLIDGRCLRSPLDTPRLLPGVALDPPGQLCLLESLVYGQELLEKGPATPGPQFSFANGSFGPGDAEFLYSLIRLKKPARIIEIGSGNSTLMALRAVQRNRQDDPSCDCRIVCIEPFEMPWLETTGVTVIRELVEDVDRELFAGLARNDLLFIDSSHVIRPQGDVVYEILELLPTLAPGVVVHFHDIFTPRDYPREWIVDEVRLWNEQYLLEAFLSGNRDWRVLGALNYLSHDHFEQLRRCCPHLAPDSEPGSFYIVREG